MIQLRKKEETPSWELTPAEKVALHLLPVDQATTNVDTNEWSNTTWKATKTVSQEIEHFMLVDCIVTITDTGQVYAAGTLGAQEAELADLRLDIPEETLKQVGPAASARKLLAMRRDFLANPRRETPNH